MIQTTELSLADYKLALEDMSKESIINITLHSIKEKRRLEALCESAGLIPHPVKLDLHYEPFPKDKAINDKAEKILSRLPGYRMITTPEGDLSPLREETEGVDLANPEIMEKVLNSMEHPDFNDEKIFIDDPVIKHFDD